MTDIDLSEVLLDATADPPPTNRIDLDRARTDGARIRLRRGVVATVASAVTVVGLVTGGIAVASQGFHHGTASTGDSADSPDREAVAPTNFDPTKIRITVGWLPEYLRTGPVGRTESSALGQQFIGFSRLDQTTDGTKRATSVMVSLYRAGEVPAVLAAATTAGATAPGMSPPGIRQGTAAPGGPEVNGHPGFWSGTGTLAWQWAEHGWATVTVDGANLGAEPLAVALRVATATDVTAERDVVAPFTAVGPPPPFQLTGNQVVQTCDGTVRTTLGLTFSTDPASVGSGNVGSGQLNPLTLTVAPSSAEVSAKHPPTATYAGHPAYVSSDPTHIEIILFDVDGYQISVSVAGPLAMASISTEAAIQLALGVRVVGNAADPTTWVAPLG